MVEERWYGIDRMFGAYEGKRILDLGCNDDLAIARLAGDKNEVIRADIDASSLYRSVNQKEDYVRSSEVCADACDLPFKDSTFDVVYCSALLNDQHTKMSKLVDYDDTDIPRVLKPGGSLIIVDGITQRAPVREVALPAMGLEHFLDETEFEHAGLFGDAIYCSGFNKRS